MTQGDREGQVWAGAYEGGGRHYNTAMQKWLARLSFSFMILAAVLVWDAYRALRGYGRSLPEWQIYLEFAAAVVSFGLGLAGVRARHRPLDERDDERR